MCEEQSFAAPDEDRVRKLTQRVYGPGIDVADGTGYDCAARRAGYEPAVFCVDEYADFREARANTSKSESGGILLKAEC
jgi:hypothetical protein